MREPRSAAPRVFACPPSLFSQDSPVQPRTRGGERALMQTILVPTATHDVMHSVLETALLAARRFDAYVEGFAIRPLITEYVPVDMVGGLTWTRDDITDEQAIRQSRETFDRFMGERGV